MGNLREGVDDLRRAGQGLLLELFTGSARLLLDRHTSLERRDPALPDAPQVVPLPIDRLLHAKVPEEPAVEVARDALRRQVLQILFRSGLVGHHLREHELLQKPKPLRRQFAGVLAEVLF